LVFGSKSYVATVEDYRLSQEYIVQPAHGAGTPEQSGLCRRFVRTIKVEFMWYRRFASIDEARREVRTWSCFYNGSRPPSRFGWK
jgi:putative transposase